MDGKKLKTLQQVAAHFGVNAKQVTQWIRDGKLRAMDISRDGSKVPRYRFSAEAIEELKQALQARTPVTAITAKAAVAASN